MLNGGVSFNVVPSEMSAAFDIRIAPTVNLEVRLPLSRRGQDRSLSSESQSMDHHLAVPLRFWMGQRPHVGVLQSCALISAVPLGKDGGTLAN